MDLYGEQDTEYIPPYYLKFGCTTLLFSCSPVSYSSPSLRVSAEQIPRRGASARTPIPSNKPCNFFYANFGIAGSPLLLLSFIIMHGCRQRQLPVWCDFVAVVFQEPRDVGVGYAVVVAAKADIVLFELNGPKRGVEFSVLILTVHVDSTHEAH